MQTLVTTAMKRKFGPKKDLHQSYVQVVVR